MSYLSPSTVLINLHQLKILKLHQDTLHNISSTSMHDELHKTVCLLLIRIYKCIFSIAQCQFHIAHTQQEPPVPWAQLGGPHGQSRHAEGKTFLPLLGIKPQFLSQPAHGLVTTPSALPHLNFHQTKNL